MSLIVLTIACSDVLSRASCHYHADHSHFDSLCDPRVDDADNALLSYKHGFCVVSIPYRLSPDYPFPTPTHDCAALIQAVLADDSIPGDRNRVIVGGYSAGGNLSLSAVQLHGLHDKVSAVVAYYPVVNYTLTLEDKLSTSVVAPGKKKDLLENLGPIFNWAYIPIGQDRKDPLLSPAFAERSQLPKKLCILGCQYDLLCDEARTMARDLARLEAGNQKDTETGWVKGNLKWMEIPEVEHGFNQMVEKDKAKAAKNRAAAEKMHQEVAEWIYSEVFV